MVIVSRTVSGGMDLNIIVILSHHVITKGNIYENSELLNKLSE